MSDVIDKAEQYRRSLTASNTIPNKVIEVTHDVEGRPLPHPIKFNSRLAHHMRQLPQWNDNDWDSFGIIVGKPGVGKSVLAQKIALFLNANTRLGNIQFSVKQFNDWIGNLKDKKSVCIFDEADELTEHHAKGVTKSIIRQSKRMRTKNAYVLLATPTLRDINQHFIYRARFIIYIPMYGPTDRGYFHYYAGEDNIYHLFERLKERGERQKVYNECALVIRNGYHGRDSFEGWFIDKDSYEERKEAARAELESDEGPQRRKDVRKTMIQVKNTVRTLTALNGKEPTQKEISDFLGIAQSTVSDYMKRLDSEGGWS